MPHWVYIGVGSNLGIPEANCRRAMDLLQREPGVRVERRSQLFRSEPVGVLDQPRFVNAAALLATALSPREMLYRLLAIERRLGRVRRVKWGPRIIDLDILFYDRLTLNSPALVIPHPHIAKRRFVLAPLADLAPGLRHPRLAGSVAELLALAPGSQSEVTALSPGSSSR